MINQTQQSSVTTIKTKIKVVFLGQQSTGKTSILIRFIHDKFQQGIGATVGIDFMAKNLNVGFYSLRLQLWDTAGEQRFRSLIPSYLKDAMITFIVFDLTNRKSFENLTQWFELCNQNKRQKAILILLGNKCDLSDQQVTQQQAIQKSQQYHAIYYQVSAKTGYNIKNAINDAGIQYVNINLNQNQILFSKGEVKNLKIIKEEQKEVNLKNQKISIMNQKKVAAKQNKKKKCC